MNVLKPYLFCKDMLIVIKKLFYVGLNAHEVIDVNIDGHWIKNRKVIKFTFKIWYQRVKNFKHFDKQEMYEDLLKFQIYIFINNKYKCKGVCDCKKI